MEKMKRKMRGKFSPLAAVFVFFIFGLGISIQLVFPSLVRAASSDPIITRNPLPISVVTPQSLDLATLKGIDLSTITPAATSTDKLLSLSVVVKAQASSSSTLSTNQSFGFKLVPQQRDARNFTIESQFNSFNLKEVLENNQKYQRISLVGKNSFVGGGEGQAGLPGFTKIVAIPVGAEIKVEVIEGEPEVISNITPFPVQPMTLDQSSTEQVFETTPPFIDKINYRQNQFLPTNLYTIRYDVLRGCKVAVIQVTTARYNAFLRKLQLYPDLALNISFDKGQDSYIPEEMRSLYFEDTYSSVLANYSMVKPLSQAELLAGAHTIFEYLCDLLIITPEEFSSQAETLAAWKREKGFKTWVRTLDDIQAARGGTSAGDIRAYIKNIYSNNGLSYVLLMGDAEFIPVHYQTPAGVACTPTDLYYAEMDAAGYFPDLAIGRLPVNSQAEAERVVNRTINYEKTPPTDSAFYKRVILGAYFQDEDYDGRDNRNYVQTIQELNNYFSGHGYTVQREYVSSSSNPQYYQDGSALPSDLKKPGFPWDGNASRIVAGLNAGAVLLGQRDHGGRSGWSHPGFTTLDLAGLDTGNLNPVVFSINCQSGWFDEETDSDASTTTESFAEQILTKDGGALAVIAATRNSPTYPNDDLIRGLTEYLWPDFYLATTETAKSKRLGDVLNAAKYYVESGWSGSDAKSEFELFHCLGDPTVELWTKNPHPSIAIPWSVLLKEIKYAKLPKPIPDPDPAKSITGQYAIPTAEDNVMVTFLRDGEILGQAISSNGQAVINVDQSVESLENVEISYRSPSGYTTIVSAPQGTGEPQPGVPECQCDEGDYGTIDLGDAVGKTGAEVRVPVRIHGAENDVESLGFEIVYDSVALAYSGYEKGPLSQSFDMLAVSDLGNGHIRIGGYDGTPDSDSIVQNSQGDLIYLKFEIISDQEDCQYPLRVESLEDDIKLWSASGGCVKVAPPCDGDMNGDGHITPVDALIVFRCVMQSGPCSACCDINGDGEVTSDDAACIFRKYMRLPSCLDENPLQ